MEENNLTFEEKLKYYFKDLGVNKSQSLSFFNNLSLPAFVRDWFMKKYGDKDGNINPSFLLAKISEMIPRKDNWKLLLEKIMNSNEDVKILAKLTVKADITKNLYTFEMADLGVSHSETLINPNVLKKSRKQLLSGQNDIWGVLTLRYQYVGDDKKRPYRIILENFVDYKPYSIDLKFYTEVRENFTFEEWIDVLLTAIDYNPHGFSTNEEKIMLLTRLIPFVEKRLNLIEFAPKGTGKSYVFSQISKYGWLNSGGVVTRAKLFYNMSNKTDGLIPNYDYVCLDEISNTQFTQLPEIQASLKGYLENGKYTVGTKYGTSESGIVVLGNIDEEFMDSNTYFMLNMITKEHQRFFDESALLDRFHGFLEGWKIGRMTESKKISGWGLNTEYFSEIMHQIRFDLRYEAVYDSLITIPKDADTRDTQAIKKLSIAFMKLWFPHWTSIDKVESNLFENYCLKPAMNMRQIIKTQLGFMDTEFKGKKIPDILVTNHTS